MMFGCVVTEYYYNSFYAPSVSSSIVYLKQAFDHKDLSVALHFCQEKTLKCSIEYFSTYVVNRKHPK